ncbi:MAG: endonuclease/exonuclease/phosphatase family protein [Actinomycetes bacterium]
MRASRATWLGAAAIGLAVALGACTAPESETTPSEAATVRVMQFNVEYGGTLVDFDSVPAAVDAAGADVVALQEAYGNSCDVADALGWAYCDRRTQTISRYPLVTPDDPESPAVLVAVEPGQVFGVVNVHLPSAPYGPNRAAAGATEAELIAGEKGRLKALEPALNAADSLRGDGIPVVLIGDFNAPSHLDWVAETKGLRDHVTDVQWPVSTAVEAAGLVDAYRQVHPDPVADQGLTWPASRPKVGTYNPGPDGKPADRIDMTFVSDGIAVEDSSIVGEEGSPDTEVVVAPWPTDHRAVVSQLNVSLAESGPYIAPATTLIERGTAAEVNVYGLPAPSAVLATPAGQDAPALTEDVDGWGTVSLSTRDLPVGRLALLAVDAEGDDVASGQLWISKPGASPTLNVGKGAYNVGEPIDVAWSDAPGNKWDWLGVYKRGSDPNVAYYKLWTYTGATIVGSASFDAKAKGGAWPLPPGKYDMVLLEDDSYDELARAPFAIQP